MMSVTQVLSGRSTVNALFRLFGVIIEVCPVIAPDDYSRKLL